MTPGAVLLDLYDTLVFGDWSAWRGRLTELTGLDDATIARAYERTRHERNTGVYPTATDNVRELFRAAGVDEPDAALVATVTEAEARFGDEIRSYDDTVPTLAALRAASIPTAIVSNCSHGTREIVERLGLAAGVDAVVLSCELGVRKPDPGIYRSALGALGAEAHRSVFVDDQTAYCDGARALGIETALIVRPAARPVEGFAPANGHLVIGGLDGLLPLLAL